MTVQVNRELIRQLRIKRSYSQEKLAEIVGVNLRTIQRVETNGAASLATRGALARALGVRPEALDVQQEAAGDPIEARRRPSAFLTLSVALVLLGATVLAVSIESVTPIGLLTLSAVGGSLMALIGFVVLALLTPLRRWRAYVILSIIGLALVASPPAWAARFLLVISLWGSFELGVLATKLRPRSPAAET